MRHLTFSLAALLLVVCSAASPGFCETTKNPITISLKIGYVADLTGPGNFFSYYSTRGASLAADSRSKSNGRQISLIVEDIAGKFPNAVVAAQKLISIDKVDAIICDLTGPCTAIAQLVKDSQKILIYNSPATSIVEKHSNAYRNFIDYTEACRAIALYFQQSGEREIGSVNANLEFGQRCHEGIEKIFPNHPAYRYNPHDDLRQAPLFFKDKSLSSIMFTGFEDDFVSWLKLASSSNLSVQTGVIDFLLTDSLLKEIAPLQLNGIGAGLPDVTEAFRDALSRKFSDSSQTNVTVAALAHNAVVAIDTAMQSCPDRSVTCLQEALKVPRQEYLLDFKGWNKGTLEYTVYLKKIVNGRSTILNKVVTH